MKYKTIPSSTNLYFVSSSVTKWVSIFTNDSVAMIPLNSLDWLRKEKIWKLYAFCLMPNHLHILVELIIQKPIEKIMEQFHSFTGHEIIKRLRKEKHTSVIQIFMDAAVKKGDRNFLIWNDSLARCVEQENVLLETLEYVHNNPINKKWHLVLDRADYRYSSACFYDASNDC